MNQTLTTFTLNLVSSSKFPRNSTGPEILAKALKVNRTLTTFTLHLEYSEICYNDLNPLTSALDEALKENQTLTTLSLSFNNRYYTSNFGHEFIPKIRRNSDLQSLAFQAAEKGDLQKLNELLNQGVSLYSTDNIHRSFLHIAAQNGHTEVAADLLERSHNPTYKTWLNQANKTAYDLALENGHKDILDSSIEQEEH